MRRFRRGPPYLRSALALIICCLASVIYWEVNLQPGVSMLGRTSAPRSGVIQAIESQDFTMPPLRSFGEVLDRPLFSATRRPEAEAAASGTSQPTPSRLIGIVFSEFKRLAIVEIGQPASIERVTEGGRVGNWTIEQILPDRIIVRNPAGLAEVKPGPNPTDAGKAATSRRPAPGPTNSPLPRS
ncbi:MAG: pilus assembly protein PilZ [Rhodospirillales bacterium]|nr:pilus assembly protein PilZ [Rhodospirillales bacterium]